MLCSKCGGNLYIDESGQETMWQYGLICIDCGHVEAESDYFEVLFKLKESQNKEQP